MKKWFLVICLAFILLIGINSKSVAAPRVDLEGSKFGLTGAYVPYYSWHGGGEFTGITWSVYGRFQLNLHTFTTLYAAVDYKLTSFTENDGLFVWIPLMQDYYWKVAVGLKEEHWSLEFFVDQYCIHPVEFITHLMNQYTTAGISLEFKL